MKKKSREIMFMISGIFMLVMNGCSSTGSSNLSKMDKDLDKNAKPAAEKYLKAKVEECSEWTTVKTGALEYRYALYNEKSNCYKVVYYAKFDEEDEPEDQWMEVDVELTGEKMLASDVNGAYMDANSYEHFNSYIPQSSTDDHKIWYNVNLTQEEKEILKNKEN